MKTRNPSSQDIDRLVAYMPRLYSEIFTPVKKQAEVTTDADGVIIIHGQDYDKLIEEFYKEASNECWMDHNYEPEDAIHMLENEDFIKCAVIDQIKTMITYCVRGERFCEGHWSNMITSGKIKKILQRLTELKN